MTQIKEDMTQDTIRKQVWSSRNISSNSQTATAVKRLKHAASKMDSFSIRQPCQDERAASNFSAFGGRFVAYST